MTLTSLPVLLAEARTRRVGVGSFNVITLEHAEGLLAAAESLGAPVILQISQNCVDYHGGRLAPLARATLVMAESATVPAAVHLDHADREELIAEAIGLGLSSVMFDGSRLPYPENVSRTALVVQRCQIAGVAVEAELGEVGGKDGVHTGAARTDPQEASAFVAATGVDALAVAVGTSHAKAERDLRLDLVRIAALAAAVPVPLVLHGSSSVSDAELARGVAAGLTKINLATHLNGHFTRAVRDVLTSDDRLTDPRRYLAPGREALQVEAERLIGLLGTAAMPG